MFLNLLIKVNKKKLDRMIENGEEYKKILKRSQKLDEYIAKKMKKTTN